MQLTKNCEMMRTYVQGHFDRRTELPGIVGVLYDPQNRVYGFYFNTELFVAHNESVFPADSVDGMKMMLKSIAAQAVLIAEASERQNEN